MDKNDYEMKLLLYKETVLYSTEQVIEYYNPQWLKN